MLRAHPEVIRRTRTADETEAVAERLARHVRAGDVILLAGELGVGKTTFVRGLHRGMTCAGRVRSPSYLTLIEYAGSPPLFHFDLFRYDAAGEGFWEEFGEWIDGAGVSVVEWSERFDAGAVPKHALDVRIVTDGDARVLTVTAVGEWGERLRDGL